ncbi:MAG: hypothetical protein KBC21_03370 [Candidatus Pacebacteria bacterium]|nr:hypothetical protein [Candidatus Paceibacterota bacterium]
MKYHFIGICGAGMSAVAKLLLEKGHSVTGSDEGFYPPISDYLVTNNISCLTPFKKENIPNDVDYIVIGKHAKLTPQENEEVKEAFCYPEKVISFPEALEALTKERENIVVAGSYGKSTCTSLLSHILEKSGVDTGYFIGAIPLTPTSNAHLGTAMEFILEGDEYPSSNWDTSSKFLHYHPKHTLITALAHDHVNVYPTHEDYILPFIQLIKNTSEDGVLVLCKDDVAISQKCIPTLSRKVVTYGLGADADYQAINITYDETTTFEITKSGEHLMKLSTSLLGAHNVQNTLGVVALLLETKKVSIENIILAVASFKGIVRRLDKKSYNTSIPIYEGFGSSFDKAASAIEAMTLHFPKRKLLIIFEPHTFSWRNRQALHWYDNVFDAAEHVYVYKPPLHGSNSHDQLTHEEIIDRIRLSGANVSGFDSPDKGISLVEGQLTDEHVILILSSGGMDGLIPLLVSTVEKQFPTLNT